MQSLEKYFLYSSLLSTKKILEWKATKLIRTNGDEEIVVTERKKSVKLSPKELWKTLCGNPGDFLPPLSAKTFWGIALRQEISCKIQLIRIWKLEEFEELDFFVVDAVLVLGVVPSVESSQKICAIFFVTERKESGKLEIPNIVVNSVFLIPSCKLLSFFQFCYKWW